MVDQAPADIDTRSLSGNIYWAFAGNVVYAACQWAVLAIFTKRLSQSDVGTFALSVAITGPVFVLTNLRLRNLLATGVKTPNGVWDFVRLRLVTTVIAFLACVAVGSSLQLNWQSVSVLLLVAAAKSFDAFSDICHGFFQSLMAIRRSAIGLGINGVLSVALVWACLAITDDLRLAVLAYLAGSFCATVLWDLPNFLRLLHVTAANRHRAQSFMVGFRAMPLWQLAVKSAPLGLSTATGSLQAYVPHYVIASTLGSAPLAVFAALAYLPTAGNMVVGAISQASLPVLSQELVSAPEQYRKRVLVLVGAGLTVGLLGGVVGALWGQEIISVLYTPEYAKEIPLLLWLIAASGVTYAYMFLGTAATVRQRYSMQLLISVLGLVAVASLAVPLTSSSGAIGTARALFIAAIVQALAYACLTVHDFRQQHGPAGLSRAHVVMGHDLH